VSLEGNNLVIESSMGECPVVDVDLHHHACERVGIYERRGNYHYIAPFSIAVRLMSDLGHSPVDWNLSKSTMAWSTIVDSSSVRQTYNFSFDDLSWFLL